MGIEAKIYQGLDHNGSNFELKEPVGETPPALLKRNQVQSEHVPQKLPFTKEEYELLQNAWRHFDTDGNGRIDKDEFHDFMSSHIVSDRIGIVGRKHSDLIFEKIDD